ncbi:hypothetical protein, partial [uncultured Thiocystis sp.]|uniref:hypothetical protein n=1 Tax=uncultured Thiocystis sp. TaxID=1202134 RepID=UPI0025E4067F
PLIVTQGIATLSHPGSSFILKWSGDNIPTQLQLMTRPSNLGSAVISLDVSSVASCPIEI